MTIGLEHEEAMELLKRIQNIISKAGETEGSQVLAFNLIKSEVESTLNPPEEPEAVAYEVFNADGSSSIVYATSRSKAKYESDAYTNGLGYAEIRAIRRPDLDHLADELS